MEAALSQDMKAGRILLKDQGGPDGKNFAFSWCSNYLSMFFLMKWLKAMAPLEGNNTLIRRLIGCKMR